MFLQERLAKLSPDAALLCRIRGAGEGKHGERETPGPDLGCSSPRRLTGPTRQREAWCPQITLHCSACCSLGSAPGPRLSADCSPRASIPRGYMGVFLGGLVTCHHCPAGIGIRSSVPGPSIFWAHSSPLEQTGWHPVSWPQRPAPGCVLEAQCSLLHLKGQ